jgi:hypothetical protein
MDMPKKLWFSLLMTLCWFALPASTFFVPQISAAQVLGIHILHPAEIPEAADLIKTADNADAWSYVTIPLSLADLEKESEWQEAFIQASELKINPIVRLTTRFNSDQNAWEIPTRADILALFDFLRELPWPHEKKYLIVFNEPNHQTEWGGTIDPTAYASTLEFVTDWAHTENMAYQILPAAMDLAAPNGSATMEALTFLNKMYETNPEVFQKIDYWNSHSYPNPAFSAPATKTGQNSLHGFEHELKWLAQKTERELKVFITETGWEENATTRNKLAGYYATANKDIWSDESVVAVTPFVFKGDPGPFSKFSMIDKDGSTTRQYAAYATQIAQTTLAAKKELENLSVTSF